MTTESNDLLRVFAHMAMRRCPECNATLTPDDMYGHECASDKTSAEELRQDTIQTLTSTVAYFSLMLRSLAENTYTAANARDDYEYLTMQAGFNLFSLLQELGEQD